MCDVGGQRSKRKCRFECFLIPSSELDQMVGKIDDQCLTESLSIFERIVNNQVFSNVAIILFLNETDLLEEKLQMLSTRDYFLEFEEDSHCLRDV